jgi:hypothetical protein
MIRIGVRSFVAGGPYTPSDADALAFVNAAEITNDTQKLAINNLVTDLKGYSIWTKMKAIYPFCGGTASSHKWNLKDARDLDAAFRLVFNGGFTHNQYGIQPNGVNGYADTFFNLATNFTTTNAGATVYRYQVATSGSDIATYAGGNFNVFYNTATSTEIAAIAFSFTGTLNYTPTYGGLGMTTTSALSGTTKGYENGVVKLTNTTQGNPANINSQIGRNTYGVEYSNGIIPFVAYHDGLTDTEAANLYTAVQAYQTTLSRNV